MRRILAAIFVVTLFLACSSSHSNETTSSSGGSSSLDGAAGWPSGGSAGVDASTATGGSAGVDASTATGGSAGVAGASSGGGASGSGGAAGANTDGGQNDGCTPKTACEGACNADIPDGCGGLLSCGVCSTGFSCVNNTCDQMAVTRCLQCPPTHPNQLATIPNVDFCGTSCASPGVLKVCLKDPSYYLGVFAGTGCSGGTAADIVSDCAGDKQYVCVKN